MPDLTDFSELQRGLPDKLPCAGLGQSDTSVPHAPKRSPGLSAEQTKLALSNALRYFPKEQHAILAPEFMAEFNQYGHIYM